MQMLFIRFLLILFFSISLSYASPSFIDQFHVKPIINKKLADRITQYNTENIKLSLTKQKSELLKINNQLSKLDNHSDKAIYWFIRGLHYKNIAAFYMESNEISLAHDNIKNKDSAYKKAIALNQEKQQLSAAIFSTMKLDLPEDLKILATENEIALGGNGNSDSYYWYLHWSNIDQLQNAGRQDEAKAAYKKMQQELKNSGMDMSVYGSLTKKIETQTLNINNSKSLVKKEQTTSKPKTEPKEKTKPKKYDTKFIIISSIAVFSIISLIAVIIYEMKRKRKKKPRK